MISQSQFISKIKEDFPNLIFNEDENFYYCAKKNTVYHNPQSDNYQLLLLHELAHYSLGHESYKYDIDRLKMESEAWSLTKKTLCPKYQIEFDNSLAEEHLDSYRDWVYKMSECPACNSTGYQDKNADYHCLACSNKWKSKHSQYNKK